MPSCTAEYFGATPGTGSFPSTRTRLSLLRGYCNRACRPFLLQYLVALERAPPARVAHSPTVMERSEVSHLSRVIRACEAMPFSQVVVANSTKASLKRIARPDGR